jgi:POT family proton-dependent oligopeptide transporter
MTEIQQKGHPKGLYLLYFTELWERFSYYGMRAIFTLYMVNALLLNKDQASSIYGSYTGLVYLTPLLGGYIADRYWGNRKSIMFGGILMAIGQFIMFFSGSFYANQDIAMPLMFGGLGFLIFGNGFFKPNISTMVGQLYKEGDRRVDSAFTIFYQGINMGALIAPAVCGTLGEQYDVTGAVVPGAFKYGFLAAGIGMIISLIMFYFYKNRLLKTPDGVDVGMKPEKVIKEVSDLKPSNKIGLKILLPALIGEIALFSIFKFVAQMDIIGSLIFSLCLVLPAVIISDPSLTKIEKSRIWVIYIIAFFVIFFWSAFEQAGASLTFFAQEQTNRDILGWNMPASLFQSFNAMFIVILAPVFVAIWSFLGRKNIEPSSPVKQSIGLAFLALGYLFIAFGVNGINPWDKVSMIWLVGLYLIHTIGELCLSPIGLSMVVKLAPVRLASLLMGVWFMSTATANKFAGELSSLYPEDVKIVAKVDAKPEILEKFTSLNYLDTASLWKLGYQDSAIVKVASTNDIINKESKELTNISTTADVHKVSVYHLNLVRNSNSKMNNFLVDNNGKYLYVYKKDMVKDEEKQSIEIFDLKPEKPKFLSIPIKNLFDFFMIFVFMAGGASLILFLISKKLLKMMHGIR